MSGAKGQALLKALRTELEAEGGVLRTTDEYVDALIGYKIRRLVRKHVLAVSLLAGAGASGAALLGHLLQALARGPLAKTGRAANSSALARPPSRERPPAPSDEEEEAAGPASGGGQEGGGGGAGRVLHALGRLVGSGPGVILGAALTCAAAVIRTPPERPPGRPPPRARRRNPNRAGHTRS